MTIATLIQAAFLLIAAVTLGDFLRHRDRPRLDIALMFACLATSVLGGFVAQLVPAAQAWLSIVDGVAVLAQPYFLLRLAQHFRPVHRLARGLALAGLLLSAGLLIVVPQPLPPALTVAVVLYFVGVEVYATGAFVLGALAASGVVRWRLLFASAGSGWLATVILLAGVAIIAPAAAALLGVLGQFASLLSAICYFIGFAPPRRLRQAWQLAELYHFLRQSANQPARQQVTQALDGLCVAASRAVGGLATAVWLVDVEQARLTWRATREMDATVSPAPLSAGPIWQAWKEQRPVVAQAAPAGGDISVLAPEAGSLMAVPLATADHAWGMLAVYLRRISLFPDDDIDLLVLFAAQGAQILERQELFGTQRSLLKQVEQANQELRAEIAERQQAQQALAQRTLDMEQTARSLAAVVEHIPAMIFMKDEGLRFVEWNNAAEVLVGLARADVLGRTDYDFFPAAEADAFVAKDRAVLNGGQLLDIAEEKIHTVQRGVRVLHTRKVPILDAAGQPKYLLGISEDITERQEAEAQIRQLNADLLQRATLLEAANQELEAFSYSVSHDLRAPLRSIDGFSQALLDDYNDQLDQQAQDFLGRIRRAAQRMGQLIDDLLGLSKLTRSELRREAVDLSQLARTVLAELQAGEPGRKVEIVVAGGLTGRGDSRLLRVALENLLANAWKFSSRQPQARIEFSAAHDGEQVYCVRDNGAGFDMAHADRLFGAFQRIDSSADFPGTGIGLATVKRIIHRHGGRVWATAAPGLGAAFYFTLGPDAA